MCPDYLKNKKTKAETMSSHLLIIMLLVFKAGTEPDCFSYLVFDANSIAVKT